ncbi:YjbH domain-containing protein [Gammaproteobacteria bacterium]|nr:YjbH domain-containing protein [Gammaproteobacteria bacterium]
MFVVSLSADYSDNYQGLGSSYNSFGQVGLIQTPTANSKEEGTVSLILNKNDIWKFGTLSVSPFNWLEASYFYYRPFDLTWEGDGVAGHYLDKGFNVKFKYKSKNNNKPELAIGLDDFAGTGYFTREYIVATQELRDMKVTLGMGWGYYAAENSFDNPLSLLSEGFNSRPNASDNFGLGGNLSYDKWFRGNASLFGGVEYFIPNIKGLSIKIENDPFIYTNFSALDRPIAFNERRKKDSNINVGISFKAHKFLTIDASYIKGNTFNLSFTIGATFNESLSSKPKFKPSIVKKDKKGDTELNFYEDLLLNLNNNNLFLQTASLSKKELGISISTSEYRNSIRSSSYAASIAHKVSQDYSFDFNKINITNINAGIELNTIGYISNYLNNNAIPIELLIRNTTLDSGSPNKFLEDKFKPKVNFPVIFSSISPVLVTHIGNPEKFFFGGINIQHISEVQFSRNLLLSSEINMRVYDDFEDTIAGPGSVMEHVRTDLVEYLKEDDVYISRMQLDYIWSPRKEVYTKISGGIYETMFAGIGAEALYRPFNKNFNIGAELFYVRQRSYNQLFDLRDYSTVTGHINFGYRFPLGIETKLSYGRYLAKDDGFTFDLGRTTRSGFKAGIYFTRTDVSAETFGEGSFDKGFYFQVPLDLFTKKYQGNYSSFKLSPLTRDGGAKLVHDKDLRGLIYNSTYFDLYHQWDGYNN